MSGELLTGLCGDLAVALGTDKEARRQFLSWRMQPIPWHLLLVLKTKRAITAPQSPEELKSCEESDDATWWA